MSAHSTFNQNSRVRQQFRVEYTKRAGHKTARSLHKLINMPGKSKVILVSNINPGSLQQSGAGKPPPKKTARLKSPPLNAQKGVSTQNQKIKILLQNSIKYQFSVYLFSSLPPSFSSCFNSGWVAACFSSFAPRWPSCLGSLWCFRGSFTVLLHLRHSLFRFWPFGWRNL